MPVPVQLSAPELFQCALVGVMRQCLNIKHGRDRRPAYGAPTDQSWNLHVEGAAGECAVAKHLGLYWTGNIGDLRADDVGTIQVRTRRRHDYDLLLHPEDPDDRVFILVTGRAPSFQIHGWIRAVDGKQKGWWKDPAGDRPAYFVPQSALRPMNELMELAV
jgi:hypothetical protein